MIGSTSDKDKGWKRILKDMKEVNNTFVKVGVLESAAPPKNGQMSMAKLAAIQEYGTQSGTIPSRPFMRQTIDRIKAQIIAFNKAELAKILKGKSTAQASLKKLGIFVQTEIRREFTKGNFTPNAASTIAAFVRLTSQGKSAQERSNDGKGIQNKKFNAGSVSKRPLIATDRLRNSINYEVYKK